LKNAARPRFAAEIHKAAKSGDGREMNGFIFFVSILVDSWFNF
jgi:hypothetical protein